MNRSKRLLMRGLLSAAGLGAMLATGVALAAETLDRQLAEAIPYRNAPPPAPPSRWDFDFDDGRALLRQDGTWLVESIITHGGFGCGSYRLGIRFGSGKPGCLDVNWFGEATFAIPLKHCNNAVRPHVGDGYDTLLTDVFEDVSCAERLIRCTGVCGTRQEGVLEPAPWFGE